MEIVQFNQWSKFLEALQGNPPRHRIVRLAAVLRYDRTGTPHLTMVAGYLNGPTIVEFVQYLGPQLVNRKKEPVEEIRQLFAERKGYLEGMGFTVTSGRYRLAPASVLNQGTNGNAHKGHSLPL